MNFNLTKQVDYSQMTEEQFFEFLDQEAKRIREENMIVELSPYITKYAKVAHENYSKKSIAEPK